jgi:SAM-dependent methyltransferase
MSFSESWESNYAQGRQWSRWPWSTLVSFVHHFCPMEKQDYRVLELGCGVGANVPFFKSLGVNYFAVEGSRTAVDYLHTQFPELKKCILQGDVTQPFPFSFQFDLIVDRGCLTCNSLPSLRKAVNCIENSLAPEGLFIGVDWFSASHPYTSLGIGLMEDSSTRTNFPDGPLAGIGPARFFTQEEIENLFRNFTFLSLSEETRKSFPANKRQDNAVWHFVVRKSLRPEGEDTAS